MRMKNEPQVNTEYKAAVADINELLAQIKQATYNDGCYQTINWGHVGSARHVKKLLMEILMFQTMADPNVREDEFMANLETELKAKREA